MEAGGTADLRPLSVGEVLDVAIKICVRHAKALATIVVLLVAPLQVLAALVGASATSTDVFATEPGATGPTFDARELWLFLTAAAVVFVLLMLAALVATAACFKAVADAYLGERPSPRVSLSFALRRLHSVLWVGVLSFGLAFLGLLFCVVPGVWLFVSFAVAVPVLLTEGLKGRKALGRSRRLVRGRWWPTFAIVLIGTLLGGIVAAVVEGVLQAVTLADPGNELVAFVTSAVSGTISATITTPFTAAFLIVLYFDLRVRKEGFDLELLAERIGLAQPPEGGLRPAPPLAPPPRPTFEGEQPPYWPPPPGWRPPSDQTHE